MTQAKQRKNNRQNKYGESRDWYYHPTKGYKRLRPHERAYIHRNEAKADYFLKAGKTEKHTMQLPQT